MPVPSDFAFPLYNLMLMLMAPHKHVKQHLAQTYAALANIIYLNQPAQIAGPKVIAAEQPAWMSQSETVGLARTGTLYVLIVAAKPTHPSPCLNPTCKDNLMAYLKKIALIYTVLVALTSLAYANDCTTPNGQTGEIIFNDTYKVMQYCDGTNWIAMTLSKPALTDGNKGDLTISNNGGTWTVNPRSCPTGWTLHSAGNFCYSPTRPATTGLNAQQQCKTIPYADTCSPGEIYAIGPAGTINWTNMFCTSTQIMSVTVNAGWNCIAYNTSQAYRCCMPNPANLSY